MPIWHDLTRTRSNSKTSCDKHAPHVCSPTDEDVELMCDAFCKLTTAMWFHVDLKHSEKHRWSNKCLQMTVLQLCHGHVRQHARRFFNKRCANDCVSGSCSFTSFDNVNAVQHLLQIHNFHIQVIEQVTHDRWEEFILDPAHIALAPCFGTHCQDMLVLPPMNSVNNVLKLST